MAKKSTAKSASSAPSPSKPAKSTVSKRAGARAADITTGSSPPARRQTKSKAPEPASTSPAGKASATGGRKKPVRKTGGIMPVSEEAVRLEAWLVFEERLSTGRIGDHLSDWAEAQARLTAATTVPEPSLGAAAPTA